MQDRHIEREKYFREQGMVTSRYVIPYINRVLPVNDQLLVAEIGCGEAGNLLPFVDLGCKVVGVDLAENKIENGRRLYQDHPNKENITLIAEDIYNISFDVLHDIDLIIMRDTLEHIPDQERLLSHLHTFLKPGGMIFFGFPPWRMPFGGHQQICENKLISKMPYIHLLPRGIFKALLKTAGESPAKIQGLLEVRDTRISIQRFLGIVKRSRFSVVKSTYYLINPNYEIKFKLKMRELPSWLSIPYLRDFYTTTVYFILGKPR